MEKEAIETVLTELDKQEKIINAIATDMASYEDIDELICGTYISRGECKFNYNKDNTKLCPKCIAEYYEKKVSESND